MKWDVENKLPVILAERGIKQKFICQKTDLSASTVSAIVRGQMPELPNALKIASVLGMKVEEIWILRRNIE